MLAVSLQPTDLAFPEISKSRSDVLPPCGVMGTEVARSSVVVGGSTIIGVGRRYATHGHRGAGTVGCKPTASMGRRDAAALSMPGT